MKVVKKVRLTKIAKKSGGDKYESKEDGFVIYIPQYISRPEDKGIPKPIIRITVTFED